MTYELVNRQTANSLASFESETDALLAFRAIEDDDGRLAQNLLVVVFDDEGEAVDAHAAAERAAELAI